MTKSNNLVFHIPQEMFQPSATKIVDGCFSMDVIKGQFDIYKLISPIKYNLTLTNTGDAILLSGKAWANANTLCSRCLDNVELNIEAEIDAYYIFESDKNGEINEIEEFQILPEDHNINLGEIIIRSLMIDAPVKPLCKNDCMGLCPKCGTNLNKSTCKCSLIDDNSSPFDVLKDYKI